MVGAVAASLALVLARCAEHAGYNNEAEQGIFELMDDTSYQEDFDEGFSIFYRDGSEVSVRLELTGSGGRDVCADPMTLEAEADDRDDPGTGWKLIVRGDLVDC